MTQMNLSTEQKLTHRQGEQTCGCRGGGSGMDWEFGVNRCKLLPLEWISHGILLYSSGNHVWSLVIEHDNGEKKECIHVCVAGSPRCAVEN